MDEGASQVMTADAAAGADAGGIPVLLPASFLNYSGDVSWEFALGGGRVERAGVRLAARRRIQRELGAEPATAELLALAAAAVQHQVPADGAGIRWVTVANLQDLRALVRAHQARARPLFVEE